MTRINKGLVVIALATTIAGAVEAQQSKGFTKDPRILAYDKGTDKINVAKYPAEMKDAYKVFQKQCSLCHTIARAINSDFVLDEEWQHYIRQMMDRSGSLISVDQAKTIYAFLQYDSRDRKKAQFERKSKP